MNEMHMYGIFLHLDSVGSFNIILHKNNVTYKNVTISKIFRDSYKNWTRNLIKLSDVFYTSTNIIWCNRIYIKNLPNYATNYVKYCKKLFFFSAILLFVFVL